MYSTPGISPASSRFSGRIVLKHGEAAASLVHASIHASIHNFWAEAHPYVFQPQGSFEITGKPENMYQPISVFRELVLLSSIAYPAKNCWIQSKICRNLVGRDIIHVPTEHIDAREDYMRQYYPGAPTTRNTRALSQVYALHIAVTRSLEILKKGKSASQEDLLVACLPLAVAEEFWLPLDVVTLDRSLENLDALSLMQWVIERLDQEMLTNDQRDLLTSIQAIGNGVVGL